MGLVVILTLSATVLCPVLSSRPCRVEIGLPARGMSCSVYGRIIPHIVCHDGNMFTTYQMHIDVLIMLRSKLSVFLFHLLSSLPDAQDYLFVLFDDVIWIM